MSFALMKVKDFDFVQQRIPFWYWRRLLFERKEFITFDLEHGYNYHLKEIRMRATDIDTVSNKLIAKVSMIRSVYSRVNQNKAINIALVTSPGDNSEYIPAVSPVDSDALNVSPKSEPIKNAIRLDEMYNYKEPIQFEVEWREKPNEASYIDLLLIGYKIPENIFSLWGN